MKVGAAPGSTIPIPEDSSPKNSRAPATVADTPQSTHSHASNRDEDLYVDANALRALGIGAGALALGAGVAAGAVVASQAPVDPSHFDHLNIRDQPINETPIILSHNAETMQGSLPIIATNQTMSIGDTLAKTPVRGFAIDAHYRDGVPVLNHGGIFNPLVDSPSLDTAVNPIADFLNQPGNDDEVVYIMLETYLGRNGTNDALLDMQNAFGSKLYTPADHQAFWNANGRWPSADELTANGPRVVVISNNTGTNAGVAFGQGYMGRHFEHNWEDRSGVGMMGNTLHPDIVGEFDTAEMDELIEKGGFITVDQISENDPRFFKPEDRDALAARPDVSVGGFFYVSDETARAVAFGAGIATSVGAATFGLVSGISEAVTNESTIRHVDKHIVRKLKEIEYTDIAAIKQKALKGTDEPITIDNQDLEDYTRKDLKKEITWKTISAGVFSTVSIAGGFVGLAMLFPPAFPVLAGLAIAILGTGLIATTVATVVNRRRIDTAITDALSRGSVQHQTANCQKALQNELTQVSADQGLLEKKLNAKKEGNFLKRTAQYLLAATLLFRVSSMAKYTIALVGKISWVATGAVTAVSSAVSSVVNYRDRQKRLAKLADTTAECVMPQIDTKPFWLFGATKFDKFVKKNREVIAAALRQPADTPVKDLVKRLAQPEYEHTQQALRLKCSTDLIRKDLEKFAKKKKIDFAAATKNPEKMNELVHQFTAEKVAKAAYSDTLSSGVANTFKVAAVVGSFSFLFPPVTGFMLMAAGGTALVGVICSAIAGAFERRKFRKAMEKSLAPSVEPAPSDIPATIAHHQAKKLQGFTTFLAKALAAPSTVPIDSLKTPEREEKPVSENATASVASGSGSVLPSRPVALGDRPTPTLPKNVATAPEMDAALLGDVKDLSS